MANPLVTVVCLSYNHERFVKEAITSVLTQNYSPIQLIVLDDGSVDDSVAQIESVIEGKSEITFISNKSNLGYCKSLNLAMKQAKGGFLIDLAADDILMPNRVEEGVKALTRAGESYEVNFTDAEMIDENGRKLCMHSDRFFHQAIPQGNIYKDLIHRYFICSPTLMFRKQVIDQLGGYDETLAFEDFDFLIRSSRVFNFCYTPKALVKKRIVNTSMSSRQFVRNGDQRWSTLKVCEKILVLNNTNEEAEALKKRIRYEIGVSLKLFDWRLLFAFVKFYFRLSSPRTILK